MNTSEIIHKHKIASILQCIDAGLSPAEAAQVFRKQAETIHACCDAVIKDEHEKQALSFSGVFNPQSAGYAIAITAGLPMLTGHWLGGELGNRAAQALTHVNELSVPTYQKIEEILRLKNETADILTRVEEKKKKDKEKASDRSVRSLF